MDPCISELDDELSIPELEEESSVSSSDADMNGCTCDVAALDMAARSCCISYSFKMSSQKAIYSLLQTVLGRELKKCRCWVNRLWAFVRFALYIILFLCNLAISMQLTRF